MAVPIVIARAMPNPLPAPQGLLVRDFSEMAMAIVVDTPMAKSRDMHTGMAVSAVGLPTLAAQVRQSPLKVSKYN